MREIMRCAVRAISCARAEQTVWNLEPAAYFEHGDYVIKSYPFHKPRRADATSTVRCA